MRQEFECCALWRWKPPNDGGRAVARWQQSALGGSKEASSLAGVNALQLHSFSRDRCATASVATARVKRELGNDCVDIWYCPLDGVEQARHMAWLDDGEVARYHKFASRNAAQQYFGGRVLTRAALSSYTNVPERAWRFSANAHGRPAIAEPVGHRALHFNLSHTTGAAVLAVGSMAGIGIDIEAVDRQVDIEGIGRRVFTAAENAWVASGRDEAALQRFFQLWTLKEAYMKARGRGFSLDPLTFGLSSANGRFELSCAPACEPQPARWQFFPSSRGADIKMALAVGGSDHVRIRRLTYDPISGSVCRTDRALMGQESVGQE